MALFISRLQPQICGSWCAGLPHRVLIASINTSGSQSEDDPRKIFPKISSETANLKRGTGGRSSFSGKIATIFGCTGFLGRAVVNQMGKIGTQLVLPYRGSEYSIRRLKLCGDLGQIHFQHFHLKDEDSLYKAMKHSHIVINLIGKNHDTPNFSLEDVHVTGARNIARIARECGVETLVHVSALNACEKPKPIILRKGSQFLVSKWLGEEAVREEFPKAIIFRPSDIFGLQDNFCYYYARAKRRTIRPIPLWNRGVGTFKQPVFLSDVAKGIRLAAYDPYSAGFTFQAVGPHRYELSELIDWFFRVMMRNKEDMFFRIDMRYDITLWLRLLYSELVFRRHRYFSWERLERSMPVSSEENSSHEHMESVTDVVYPDLPTLEDLGVKLTTLESKVFHIFKLYRAHAYKDPIRMEYIRPVEPAPLATQ